MVLAVISYLGHIKPFYDNDDDDDDVCDYIYFTYKFFAPYKLKGVCCLHVGMVLVNAFVFCLNGSGCLSHRYNRLLLNCRINLKIEVFT